MVWGQEVRFARLASPGLWKADAHVEQQAALVEEAPETGIGAFVSEPVSKRVPVPIGCVIELAQLHACFHRSVAAFAQRLNSLAGGRGNVMF